MEQLRPGDAPQADAALDERPPEIGGDERRMHVRAYNCWVSLLGGRAYPAIADLECAGAADFGPHAVLLDFTGGGDPRIAYLGDRLRHECGVESAIRSIADVPARSLLSRLTSQYRDILANRAPIGFEAEFVDQRGTTMLYRGILMPFSSDDDSIDFVYGVINWKALAEEEEAERLAAAARAAMAKAPVPTLAVDVPVWADGPGATFHDDALDDALDDDGAVVDGADVRSDEPLAARLAMARDSARRAERAHTAARAALIQALGLAHDLLVDADADPDAFAALLATAGVAGREGVDAIVPLVFRDMGDSVYAADLVDALRYARRVGIARGGFVRHVEGLRGGVRAMIAAERG